MSRMAEITYTVAGMHCSHCQAADARLRAAIGDAGYEAA
jgi:copper chaperone CopZ